MVFPEDSSHFRHWVFTEEVLKQKRKNVMNEAIERIAKQLESKGVAASTALFLSQEEADFLVSYYITQLIHVCAEKKYDYKVTNTAAIYMARFFLKRSVLEYDPRKILFTCILLAIKTEELSTSTSLRHFAEGIIVPGGLRLADVIDNELVILDAIDFHLLVLHARTPIGFLTTEYFQRYKPLRPGVTASREEKERLAGLYKALEKAIQEANRDAERLTLQCLSHSEIPFLFTPSQIGIGYFLHVSAGKLPEAEKFVSSLFSVSDSKQELFVSLRPRLQDLRTRLVFLQEERLKETCDESLKKAFTILKKLDKLTRLIQRGPTIKKDKPKKSNKQTPQSSEVGTSEIVTSEIGTSDTSMVSEVLSSK